jgi:hypothetical protein
MLSYQNLGQSPPTCQKGALANWCLNSLLCPEQNHHAVVSGGRLMTPEMLVAFKGIALLD